MCFRKMMGDGCKIYGIEHIDELVDISRANIAKNHKEYLDDGSITIVVGDGREGLAAFGPYDVIHVGAAAQEVPKPLLDQLAPNGIMVIPVGSFMQEILVITKDSKGNISEKAVLDVVIAFSITKY